MSDYVSNRGTGRTSKMMQQVASIADKAKVIIVVVPNHAMIAYAQGLLSRHAEINGIRHNVAVVGDCRVTFFVQGPDLLERLQGYARETPFFYDHACNLLETPEARPSLL